MIVLTPPAPLMSMNDRHHWRKRAALTKKWRDATFAAAFVPDGVARHAGPCVVTVSLPVRDRRRRDPHNYYPTVKAIIDGLVDAGLWPDDTPEWVRTTEPVLEVGGSEVVITLTAMEAAS